MRPFHFSGIALTMLQAIPGHRLAAQEAAPMTNICMAPTRVEAGSNAAAAADAARETFSNYLSGPSLKTSPLQARLEAQVREEAKLAGCPFLLLTTIKHEQKQQGSGVLGRVAAGVVQQGASEVVRGSGSTAGRIVGNAARGAATEAASNYASTVRNKDVITLGFKLETADGKVLIEGRDKRASKADGEDLLSPLVESAAERIFAAAAKHKGS
jgi:hypothetical protein